MPPSTDPAYVFMLDSNHGKIPLTIMGGLLDGGPKVLSYLTEKPTVPMIVITASEARRFAAFLLEQADSADRACSELLRKATERSPKK